MSTSDKDLEVDFNIAMVRETLKQIRRLQDKEIDALQYDMRMVKIGLLIMAGAIVLLLFTRG